MVKVRSSRRVAGLKLTDYDHEIGLVNHDEVDGDSNTVLSSAAGTRSGSTTSRLVSLVGDSEVEVEAQAEGTGTNENDAIERPNGNNADGSQEDQNSLQPEDTLPHSSMQPSIEVQAATPDIFHDSSDRVVPNRPREVRETAIDIMYENERGGFMCGIALFSSKALGGLDPPAWSKRSLQLVVLLLLYMLTR